MGLYPDPYDTDRRLTAPWGGSIVRYESPVSLSIVIQGNIDVFNDPTPSPEQSFPPRDFFVGDLGQEGSRLSRDSSVPSTRYLFLPLLRGPGGEEGKRKEKWDSSDDTEQTQKTR